MNAYQPSQPPEPKPVAYDAEGRPLYAAPVQPPVSHSLDPSNGDLAQAAQQASSDSKAPKKAIETTSYVTNTPEKIEGHNFNPQLRSQYANEPNIVHATRSVEIEPLEVGEETKRLHEESMKAFPDLNLSEGEFVITRIKRHPVGLWIPMASTLITIGLLVVALIAYPILAADPTTGEVPGLLPFTVALMCLIVMVGIGGYVAIWVYLRNTFYMTNESVIQEIQHSLFSKHEQTVSLGSIEDVSYRQNGILPSVLNYGMIRLSTEGEETTYRFQYVSNPKEQIAILNNAVESFKNGRPVTIDKSRQDN